MRGARTVVIVALLVPHLGCANGSSIAGPSPEVAGMWSLVRTVVSSEGCRVLLDPTPIQIVIRAEGRMLEVDVPLPPDAALTLRGSIEPDGNFEVRREVEDPGFSSETIVVEGRFAGDAFSGTEMSDVRFFLPEVIDLLGSERCKTIIHWESERV